jgi:hypothetical protein
MKTSCLLLLPVLFLTSCATITRGIHEKLAVLSDPSGAEVKLSSGEQGVTPAKFVKSRKESFTVTVSKAGYTAQTVKVESKFSATGGTAMAGNAIAGGIVGIGVDAMSGATSSLYPNPVSVHLAPLGKSSPAKRAASEKRPQGATSAPKTSPVPKKEPQGATTFPAPTISPTPGEKPPETTPPPQSSPSPYQW